MKNPFANFYFLIFVHECLGDVRVVPVLMAEPRMSADQYRDRLLLCGRGKILAGREDRAAAPIALTGAM
jgi:hypothetical protein